MNNCYKCIHIHLSTLNAWNSHDLNSPSTHSLLDADNGSDTLDTERSSKRVDSMSNKAFLPQVLLSDHMEASSWLSKTAKKQTNGLLSVIDCIWQHFEYFLVILRVLWYNAGPVLYSKELWYTKRWLQHLCALVYATLWFFESCVWNFWYNFPTFIL